jgi:hypothetical protein
MSQECKTLKDGNQPSWGVPNIWLSSDLRSADDHPFLDSAIHHGG